MPVGVEEWPHLKSWMNPGFQGYTALVSVILLVASVLIAKKANSLNGNQNDRR